jgi:Ricin-type beta-trefoil lectin domain
VINVQPRPGHRSPDRRGGHARDGARAVSVGSAAHLDGAVVFGDIHFDTCNGTAAQQWHLDSSGQIWNPHAGKCLDDPKSSTTDGTQLQIYTCNLTKAQWWNTP